MTPGSCRLVVVGVLALGLAACSSSAAHDRDTSVASEPQRKRPEQPDRPPSQEPVARVVLEPPGHDPVTVHVEIANTDAERQRGLMYRRQMDEDRGMLFLFDRTEHLSFWMHNTYIPLDMIFIGEDRRVVGIVENATPLTDDPREVEGDSRYVLEVNAGFSRRHGLGPGTLVRFVGVTEEAAPRGARGR